MEKTPDIYGKNYWFITPEKLYRCEILELDESLIFLSESVLLDEKGTSYIMYPTVLLNVRNTAGRFTHDLFFLWSSVWKYM